MTKKSELVKARVTPLEKKFIESASGGNISEFLRITALNFDWEPFKEEQEMRQKISLELRRIGNNINQIARISNQEGHVSFLDSEKIEAFMEEIWQLLKQLKKERV